MDTRAAGVTFPSVIKSRYHGSPVLEPPVVPDFPQWADCFERAAILEQQWAERVPDPEAIIGITVEKGWEPETEHDPVLNIADGLMDAPGQRVRPRLLIQERGQVPSQMGLVNALSLPGGRDVDGSKYGRSNGPGMKDSVTDPAFDDFQIACLQDALAKGMPIMGHCRGGQILNVAAGGTLVQDIPTEWSPPKGFSEVTIAHRVKDRIHPAHLIVLEPGSRLAEITQGDLLEAVNTSHHQCVAQLAPGFWATAVALDGVIEGFEREDMPWQAGYQFHPEALRYSDPETYQALYSQHVKDAIAFKNGTLSVAPRGS